MQRFFVGWVIFAVILAACAPAADPMPEVPAAPTSALAASTSTAAPAAQASPTSGPPGTGCPDPDALNLAGVIASGYTFTTPAQVVEWFCSGAEFEDIVIALETQDQTGTPAEDLLAMLAAGMTWEEIWQSIGLTE